MEITDVNFSIWINPRKGGKQFKNEIEIEELLKEITSLIKSKGFYMKEEVCGKNPSLSIHKS